MPDRIFSGASIMRNCILRKVAFKISAISAFVLLSTVGAQAAGALAMGTTGDIARDGIGVAGYPGEPSVAAAVSAALSACRNGADTPRAAAKCKIVATFSNQCFAFSGARIAGGGGPGKGLVTMSWSLGSTKESAMSQAMAKCTASARGVAACTPGFSSCDQSDDGAAPAASSKSKPNYYAIAASESSEQEARTIAAKLGEPWQVVNTQVCKNYTQGLWIVAAPTGSKNSATALAAKVKGYAKQCL
jgi:hypothetical protein